MKKAFKAVNAFKTVIEKGGYDLTEILEKIDTYHIGDNLTDEERDELVILARKGANVSNSADVFAKLAELEKRIVALEQSKTENQDSEIVDEFKVGKWYYNGDKVVFEDKVYECVAPKEVVCVWNPEQYPDYWEAIK